MATNRPILNGLIAGAAGVAVMTAAEKVEQAFTHRPNSYIPAKTLTALLGRNPDAYDHNTSWNWAMHWGQGILLGALRGIMAEKGIRGPVGSLIFTNLRLLADQSLENGTGVGSPPWTWPVDEQVIDISHKAIYAVTTGIVADRLISGPPGIPKPRLPWHLRNT